MQYKEAEPIQAIKEQATVEMKPSKLKGTMQKADTLPKELETRKSNIKEKSCRMKCFVFYSLHALFLKNLRLYTTYT